MRQGAAVSERSLLTHRTSHRSRYEVSQRSTEEYTPDGMLAYGTRTFSIEQIFGGKGYAADGGPQESAVTGDGGEECVRRVNV